MAANGVVVDSSGNVYISGVTAGLLPIAPEPNAGILDAFVAKYLTAGNGSRLWVHQLGSPAADGANGIVIDGSRSTYITGTTGGQLPGAPSRSPPAWTHLSRASRNTFRAGASEPCR